MKWLVGVIIILQVWLVNANNYRSVSSFLKYFQYYCKQSQSRGDEEEIMQRANHAREEESERKISFWFNVTPLHERLTASRSPPLSWIHELKRLLFCRLFIHEDVSSKLIQKGEICDDHASYLKKISKRRCLTFGKTNYLCQPPVRTLMILFLSNCRPWLDVLLLKQSRLTMIYEENR